MSTSSTRASLTTDFLENGSLDKTAYGVLLDGDFAEIGGIGGTFTVDRTINTLDMEDSIAVAVVDVTPLIDGNPIAAVSVVRIELVDDSGWLISAWARQN